MIAPPINIDAHRFTSSIYDRFLEVGKVDNVLAVDGGHQVTGLDPNLFGGAPGDRFKDPWRDNGHSNECKITCEYRNGQEQLGNSPGCHYSNALPHGLAVKTAGL